MLQVRFAEVNRSAVQELGVNFFSTRPDATGPVDDAAVRGAGLRRSEEGRAELQRLPELSSSTARTGLGVAIKALEQKGLFQSLAEPNLIAYNGQEASFLAGGEFPVPVVQGADAARVTVMFKEFGVRLNFKPTIAGDVIRLKVRPEVSSLDFNNGITLQGFRIPALITRRAETDVELRDGQSFAIAGLLNNITQNDGADVPFLSKIPIIGYLFKSKADRKERTELMVLVTPRLVRPLNPDEVPPLPTQPEQFPAGAGRAEQLKPRRDAASRPRRTVGEPLTKHVSTTSTGDERGASPRSGRDCDPGADRDGDVRGGSRRAVGEPRPGTECGRCRRPVRRDCSRLRRADQSAGKQRQGFQERDGRGSRQQRVDRRTHRAGVVGTARLGLAARACASMCTETASSAARRCRPSSGSC